MQTADLFVRKERIGGGGGQGTVYVWEDTVTKQQIVGKELVPGPDGEYTALPEYEIAAKMPPHPHIVRVKGIQHLDQLHNPTVPFVCTELMAGGSLTDCLRRTAGPLPEERVRAFAVQMLLGLQHLHQNGVLHQGLKPCNVLLRQPSDEELKLVDFGTTRHLDTDTALGTVPYMAPELLKADGKPSVGSDIWALGCTVLQLLTNVVPWCEVEIDLKVHILSREGLHPTIPDTLSDTARDFLKQCFAPTAADRGTCASLLGHPFVLSCKTLFSIKMVVVHEGTPVRLHYATSHINRSVPEGFLPENLLSVDLSGLSNVTQIGDGFLGKCTNLHTIDLSGLSSLTEIGDWFLADCSSLTTVVLSGLSNVKKIGKGFLLECSSLTMVDLSGLSNVTQVGDGFLGKCSGLTTVDLSVLSNVTKIGKDFLLECASLVTVNLSGLSNVTQIGDWFLGMCTRLNSVDLSGLRNVTVIGKGFLCDCTSLTTVDLSELNNVTQIGDWFLSECSSLTTVDLSGLSNVTQVGDGFLGKCSGLTTLDCSALSNVTRIGKDFLLECSSLTTVDLSGLNNVKHIGDFFLCKCASLTSVDGSGLSSVTEIGDYFLCKCASLTTVDLSALTGLKKYPSVVLTGCTNLKTKKLPPHLHQRGSCSVQ